MSPAALFALQLHGFSPGSKLDVVRGSFRGIGFGGHATVVKFDAHTLELDVRVSKLLFHIDVKLNFHIDAEGNPLFVGGRPDGKKTGSEPAQVRHTISVKRQSPEVTVFDLLMDDKTTREVAVEKTQVKGADALRITYDRFELMVASRR
jgi:hypothetical protein